MAGRIDVVVVSYNSGETLRDCVEPLLGLPGISVTVVDNGSADESLASIAGLPVRTIESGRNGGFGFGCNIGIAAGSAPLVLFLNPDARMVPAELERLAAVLDAEPEVAIGGPRIVDGAGGLFPSQRRYQRAGSTWAQAFFLHRLFRAPWANEIIKQPDAYERPAYPEWVSGACMLARREVLERVGGFDEGFFLYCEDMDLCARVRAMGYRVRYEPGATVEHDGGRSAPRTSLYAILARSRARFASLHAGTVRARLQHVGLAVGAFTHVAASLGRPAHARGHAAALRAILRGGRG
jgi:N-acetylglucosaminyl-diphospho-decaprenol L-rhamnosyltransferase